MRIRWIVARIFNKLKAIHWLYLTLHALMLVLGLWLAGMSNLLLQGLGGSLFATAIAGWVLFLHTWVSEDRFRRLELLQKFGFMEAFDNRSVRIKEEYDDRLRDASSNIDIMGFGLSHLREDYSTSFKRWAERAHVRILLLDPDFPSTDLSVASQRDKEENDGVGKIRENVHAFVRATAALVKSSKIKFDVRVYRCLPSINIFRVDNELFWGPYLIGDVSRNFPTFLVTGDGSLFKRLMDHFDKIWNSSELSRPVPDQWLLD